MSAAKLPNQKEKKTTIKNALTLSICITHRVQIIAVVVLLEYVSALKLEFGDGVVRLSC